ncbi:MAG: crossover junction endodeoxyribonuclease RuvC [Propionibacteriaceae bacterium]|nr:crossover junction endodeoxyribonuclease RuvC [Propionibacteriaceae bacterium]
MGVDPGLTRCGVGVVDGSPGRARLIEAGVIRTPTTDQTADRLLAIEQGLEDWLDRFRPEAVAIERVFAQHNLASVVGTAQAAGVAMLVAARHQLPTAQHTPSEVKAAITGSGRADKAQVGLMVARVLHLTDPPKPADAADAVALAVCHIWRSAVQDRLTLAINRSENQQHLMKTTQQLAARPHRQSSSRNYQVTK